MLMGCSLSGPFPPKVWSAAILSNGIFNFNRQFDIIYSNGALHHTPFANLIANNLSNYLNNRGKFIIMLYTKEPQSIWPRVLQLWNRFS